MLKLAILTLVPVLAATFYTQQQEPLSQPVTVDLSPSAAEAQDQNFLDTLNGQGTVDGADQAFLARLQTDDRTQPEVPVMRAIPIVHAAPVVQTIADESSLEIHEVRRATPIAKVQTTASTSSSDLRNSLSKPFVTLIESEPETRRTASTIAGDQRRASITIFGDSVVVRQ